MSKNVYAPDSGLGEVEIKIGTLVGVTHHAVGQAMRFRKFQARPSGSQKGMKHSEETKQKMRTTKQRMWSDPEYRAKHGRNLKAGREKTPSALRDAGEAEVRRLYDEERLTHREIADRLGCSQDAVSTYASRHGIKGRRSHPKTVTNA